MQAVPLSETRKKYAGSVHLFVFFFSTSAPATYPDSTSDPRILSISLSLFSSDLFCEFLPGLHPLVCPICVGISRLKLLSKSYDFVVMTMAPVDAKKFSDVRTCEFLWFMHLFLPCFIYSPTLKRPAPISVLLEQRRTVHTSSRRRNVFFSLVPLLTVLTGRPSVQSRFQFGTHSKFETDFDS